MNINDNFSCPLTYNDNTWASITSCDQDGCNEYIEKNIEKFVNKKVLHVGIGNSSVFCKFCDVFLHLDGITIMDLETIVADNIKSKFCNSCTYEIYKFNKYDVGNFSKIGKYDLIIDNNLKTYSCCLNHWIEYFHCIVEKLEKNGILLTHMQGFVPHTNRVDALSVEELEILCHLHENFILIVDDLVNEFGYYPVLIKRLG